MKSPVNSVVHRKLAAVLCSVLVGSSMVESANGKNILTGIRDTLKTDGDKPSVTDYDDAATGTVQGDMSAKQQASSCDGQLAAALVQANDLASSAQKDLDEELVKHKTSLETIVDLQHDLRETSTKLTEERDALNKLKDTMTQSLASEKTRSKEELEALETQAKIDLETLRGEKDNLVTSLKKQSAALLESAKKSADKEFQDLKTEKNDMISSLEAQLKMNADQLQATMRDELEKARNDKETQVAAITANRDEAVAKLTKDMEEAAKIASEVLKKAREKGKKKLEKAEADRDARLANLIESMEDAADEAAKLLQTTKDEADDVLAKQIEIAKQEADDAAADYEKQLSEKSNVIKELQENADEIVAKLEAIEKNMEEANAEISHWRELHSQHNYCNMTLIANDAFDASAVAYKHAVVVALDVYAESVRIAGAHVSGGLEYSNRFFNEKVQEHWPTIQPYYEEHITSNYQTHVEPHLQKHVFPNLQKASSWSTEVAKPTLLQAIDDGKKSYDSQVSPIVEQQYQGVVQLYATYCRNSLNEFLNASQELQILRDNPPPDFLLESWETSCENPRDSLSALMHGLFVLVLVIFHRRLIRMVWGIVCFSLSLVVRFTPLRFFVPRRTAAKAIASPPSSPSPLVTEASSDSLMMKEGFGGETDETDGAGEAKVF